MSRIRHLRLRAITAEGPYGADLAFSTGLNILSADNTTGKSTCLQALVYALGLERMLSARREIPLAYVMRDHVLTERGKPGPSVHEAYVALELENWAGEVLTLRRSVKGGPDWRLISTWDGPVLSQPSGQARQRDFFVRDPGAAQREAGFHAHLATFLGWQLPEVLTFEGGTVPLYVETIFPLLFVEQKAGWSAIQGPFPTFFRIQDVARRSVEFLLDLDAQRLRQERKLVAKRIVDVKDRWSRIRSEILSAAGRANVRVAGIPDEPNAELAFETQVRADVLRENEWIPLSSALGKDRERLAALRAAEVPSVDAQAPELVRELAGTEALLQSLAAERQGVADELNRCQAERAAVSRRAEQLDADLRRNRDALKLRQLGSTLGEAATEGTCPTCHQMIHTELLSVDAGQAMTLDESIRFVESQLKLYRSMLNSFGEQQARFEVQYRALSEAQESSRTRVRSIRNALLSPGTSPSEATITEKVQLEARIRQTEVVENRLNEAIVALRDTAGEFVSLLEEQRKLPSSDLSRVDSSKLTRFGEVIQEQLVAYGFSSFSPSQVFVSEQNFRPMVTLRDEEGNEVEAELGFEMSASDAIRLKWAYLLGLLEVGREFRTNHPGFLILDEPRQQEANRISFDALIRRAAAGLGAGRQVIFATSETPTELRPVLDSVDVNLIRYEGFLLERVPS